MRIVLDTNVLISGLLNPNGPPGRIIDLTLSQRLKILYDDRILAEYDDVIKRPHLKIEKELASTVLGFFRLSGEPVIASPLAEDLLPDPDDVIFIEVALSGKADGLITGNIKHFKNTPKEVNIFTPTEFIKIL